MSTGRHINHDPIAAIKNVYVVTVYGVYFFRAIVPRILYNPYPIPDPKPISRPQRVIFSPDIPDTNTHPANAARSAMIFRTFSFSLKKTTDISIIHTGDV